MTHATSGTRRGSPPPRRTAVLPRLARHRRATSANKYRLPVSLIRDAAGQLVTEIGMTPIPVDQTPFPMPYLDVPIFFTLQPGGATLHTVAGAPVGVRID